MENECYKSGRSNGLHLREECIVLLSTGIACSPSFQIEIVCVKCCWWCGRQGGWPECTAKWGWYSFTNRARGSRHGMLPIQTTIRER